jgi:hypothetical protein
MPAKMVAKKQRLMKSVVPMSDADIANMGICLRMKVSQHPELIDWLLETIDV